MKNAGSGKNDLELRTLLGAFLFSGEAVDKKIKVLSGGEKARVALAKTIASKANFLMLDEPTNHLDIHSVDLLAESLIKYEGSLILVSHDRYFISKLANKIWEIEDHKIVEFKGSYAEWEDWKERRLKQAAEAAKQEQAKLATEAKPAPAPKPKPVLTNDSKKELQKLKSRFGQLEIKLAELGDKKLKLEASLADPEIYSDKTKFLEAESAYQKSVKEWTDVNKEYENLFEKIMELEA